MNKKYNYDYYVIHLCKDTNRINNVNNLSKKIGSDINIFKGIDASTFNSTDYSSIINNYSNNLKINMNPLYPGVIGCYLSHYLLYKQLESSNLDYAIILEDDSKILVDNINEKIDSYLNMNLTFDFLFLGYNPTHGNHYTNELHYINNQFKIWGFHGYIINIKSIPKILEHNKIIKYEIDIQIFEQIKKNIFTAYFVNPKLINQYEFKSLIRSTKFEINKNILKHIKSISNKNITPVQNIKPVTKPVQNIKPVTKPVQNIKPVTKPVQNIKPVTKPVQNIKPVTKPVQNIKPVTKPVQNKVIKLLFIKK